MADDILLRGFSRKIIWNQQALLPLLVGIAVLTGCGGGSTPSEPAADNFLPPETSSELESDFTSVQTSTTSDIYVAQASSSSIATALTVSPNVEQSGTDTGVPEVGAAIPGNVTPPVEASTEEVIIVGVGATAPTTAESTVVEQSPTGVVASTTESAETPAEEEIVTEAVATTNNTTETPTVAEVSEVVATTAETPATEEDTEVVATTAETPATEEADASSVEPAITQTTETETSSSSANEVTTSEALATALNFGRLKAFPGAEGFGTDTVGGRGGFLCKVTNLNDSGSGSLRECIEASGPRMVIFEVGGTITVSTELVVRNPYISIYGQTAPGDGIMIRATLNSSITPIRVSTHDVLVQHLRFRAGNSTNSTNNRDAASISNYEPGKVYNVVMDHISFSWGVDEIMDIWYDAHDLTISHSIFSEGLWDSGSSSSGPAGRGLIVGSNGAHSISLHHLFFAHSYQRNPLVKISGIADVVNILVYHWISWGSAVTSDFDVGRVNFVKNKYIELTGQSSAEQNSSVGWGDFILSNQGNGLQVYFEDNIGYNRPTNDLPQWKIANTFYNTPYDPAQGYHTETRHAAPAITEIPVDRLEDELILDVGATLPRQDSTDLRLFDELRSRTGTMPNCVEQADRPGEARCAVNVGGWPVYNGGNAPTDSDNDGIPDDDELRLGFDPSVNDAMNDDNNDGYLNIEDWIHSIGR